MSRVQNTVFNTRLRCRKWEWAMEFTEYLYTGWAEVELRLSWGWEKQDGQGEGVHLPRQCCTGGSGRLSSAVSLVSPFSLVRLESLVSSARLVILISLVRLVILVSSQPSQPIQLSQTGYPSQPIQLSQTRKLSQLSQTGCSSQPSQLVLIRYPSGQSAFYSLVSPVSQTWTFTPVSQL